MFLLVVEVEAMAFLFGKRLTEIGENSAFAPLIALTINIESISAVIKTFWERDCAIGGG